MISRRKLVLGLAGAAGAAALSRALAPGSPREIAARRALKLPIAPSGWPSPGARVVAPSAVFPRDFGVRRVYLDAGHGAPGNSGNLSCFCVDEQDFTLAAARALAERLDATGRFEARVGRTGDRPLPYAERVEDAARWGADAFVSLHSDVRGRTETWSPGQGPPVPAQPRRAGVRRPVVRRRRARPLRPPARARARFARRMEEAGLLPYDGAAYSGLYEPGHRTARRLSRQASSGTAHLRAAPPLHALHPRRDPPRARRPRGDPAGPSPPRSTPSPPLRPPPRRRRWPRARRPARRPPHRPPEPRRQDARACGISSGASRRIERSRRQSASASSSVFTR